MEPSELPFKAINVAQRKFASSKPVKTAHDVQNPSFFLRLFFFAEKQRFRPFFQHSQLRLDGFFFYDKNLPGFGDPAEENVAPYPPSAARGVGKPFSFLNNTRHEEMFRSDEQVSDIQAGILITQEEKTRVFVARNPLNHRAVRAIDNQRSETAPFALKFKLFSALSAIKIRNRPAILKLGQRITARGTIRFLVDPFFRGTTDDLRWAMIGAAVFYAQSETVQRRLKPMVFASRRRVLKI